MATDQRPIKSLVPVSRSYVIKKLQEGKILPPVSKIANCDGNKAGFANPTLKPIKGNCKVGAIRVKTSLSNPLTTGENSQISIKKCNQNATLPQPSKESTGVSVRKTLQTRIMPISHTTSEAYDDRWVLQKLQISRDEFKDIKEYSAVYRRTDGVEQVRNTDNLVRLIGRKNFRSFAKTLQSLSDLGTRISLLQSLLTVVKSHEDKSTNTDAVDSKRGTLKNIRKQHKKPYLISKCSSAPIIKETIVDMYRKNVNCQKKPDKYIGDEPSEKILSDESDRISAVGSVGLSPSISLSIPSTRLESEAFKFATDVENKSTISLNETFNDIKNINISNTHIENRKRQSSLMQDATVKKYCPAINIDTDELLKNLNVITQFNENDSSKFENLNLNVKSENRSLGGKMELASSSTSAQVSSLSDALKGLTRDECFNLLTLDKFKSVSNEDRQHLKRLQMFIDWKYCKVPDEDGYLPIHNAIPTNNLNLLKRHCLMLKAYGTSVDIGDANLNHSAMQLCISLCSGCDVMKILLENGASPLAVDDEDRSALHFAAESTSYEYVEVLIEHLAQNPRKYLKEEQLWHPEMEKCSNDELIDEILTYAVTRHDAVGLTPLMLASKFGHSEQVMLMLERILDTKAVLKVTAPNSGNTALYLAVETALHISMDKGDMYKVPDNYALTIKQLIRYGALPWHSENYSNSSIETLLKETNFKPMCDLIKESLLKPTIRNINVKLQSTQNSDNKIDVDTDNSAPFMVCHTGDDVLDYIKVGHKTNNKRDKFKTKEKRAEPETNERCNAKEKTAHPQKPLILVKRTDGELDCIDPDVRMKRNDFGKKRPKREQLPGECGNEKSGSETADLDSWKQKNLKIDSKTSKIQIKCNNQIKPPKS